jgi:hypothetical protein
VQHPTKGSVDFILHDFQKEMVNAFNTHRFHCALAARQIGKCHTYHTSITQNSKQEKIGNLLRYSLRERVINMLERCLLLLCSLPK